MREIVFSSLWQNEYRKRPTDQRDRAKHAPRHACIVFSRTKIYDIFISVDNQCTFGAVCPWMMFRIDNACTFTAKGMPPKSPFKQPTKRTKTPLTPLETASRPSWGPSLELKQQLILDIDKRGGLGRFKLTHLLNNQERVGLYRPPNSARRRQARNQVQRWKELSASDFAEEVSSIFAGGVVIQETPVQSTKPQLSADCNSNRDRSGNRVFPFHQQAVPVPNTSITSNMNQQPWGNMAFDASE